MPQPLAAIPYETIEGRQNARLKDLRKRFLRAGWANDGLIAIEGMHLLEEAARSDLRIHSIFVRQDMRQSRAPAVALAAVGDTLHFLVAPDAFDHACVTESPQGVAALVEAPQWSLESLLKESHPLLIVLAGLQDPGNVGTILRTAEAFRASGVLLAPGTVSPWNQKVLRASAGSCFRLPVIQLEDVTMLERLQEKGIPIYACAAQNGTSVGEASLRGRVALVIGNEGSGISDEVRAYCTSSIQIPCPGPVESLNAAVAASILLYEASKQRARASIASLKASGNQP